MNHNRQDLRYPRLARRLEAVLLDVFVIILAMLLAMNLLVQINVHGGWKAAMMALIVLVLEPGMVSMTGASIGHHLRGLRVQDADTRANLGVPRALLRFLVKNLLGLYSIVFMLVTRRHQTVHDLATKSVVILKNPDALRAGHALEERPAEEAGYAIPPWPRRVVVILAYCVVALFVGGTSFAPLYSEQCLYYGSCSYTDRLVNVATGLVWIVAFGFILVSGWRGRLWGARRTKTAMSEMPNDGDDK